MKITRWSSEIGLNRQIILDLLRAERLELNEVEVQPGRKIVNQRTTLTEIFQISEGELIFNLSGNQFALRQGDKLEIPPNTSYSYSNLQSSSCFFFTARKV